MDIYRTGWGEGLASDEAADDDEEPVIEAPPPIGQDERRMQVRAYNYWAGLLGERRFPAPRDVDVARIGDFGTNAVVLDFAHGVDNPRIHHLGEALRQECGADRQIRRLADIPGRSLLSRITDHYLQILSNQAPIGFEAEFVNHAGRTVLYRGILLPLAEDGEPISQLLGVINWKEVADQATSDALLAEIDAALASQPPVPRPRPAVASRDADSPAIGRPEPGFSGDDGAGDPIVSLAQSLAGARRVAANARGAEDRRHRALYAALGAAWDFALAAAEAPAECAALLAEAAIVATPRAPFTPLVKLVFGADYDKTRLAEYARILVYAERQGVARGALPALLAQAPGGLKAILAAERAAARAPRPSRPAGLSPALARKLRRAAPIALGALGAGAEFTLLLARRDGATIAVLGEAATDHRLVARLARQWLAPVPSAGAN